jgi:hypothetical protein
VRLFFLLCSSAILPFAMTMRIETFREGRGEDERREERLLAYTIYTQSTTAGLLPLSFGLLRPPPLCPSL